ncbi:hypothetical protein N9Q00_00355 [Amylibacter sp.]|nr:hypothetical protein [Amylibacter sp.]
MHPRGEFIKVNKGGYSVYGYSILDLNKFNIFSDYEKRLSKNVLRNLKKSENLSLKFEELLFSKSNCRDVSKFIDKYSLDYMAKVPNIIVEGFYEHPQVKFFVLKNSEGEWKALIGVLFDGAQAWVNWIYVDSGLRNLGITFRLYISFIEYCHNNSVTQINFGRSINGSGVERFKKQFLCDIKIVDTSFLFYFIHKNVPALKLFVMFSKILCKLKFMRLYTVLFLILT